MSNIHHSITELIGHTPLLELHNFEKKHNAKAHILAKLEYFNATGSVKDRAALSMIEEAERTGKLKPGGEIVDLTSGNTRDNNHKVYIIPLGYLICFLKMK